MNTAETKTKQKTTPSEKHKKTERSATTSAETFQADWEKFRDTGYFSGAILDVRYEGLPNHPDPQRRKDFYFRAKVREVHWRKSLLGPYKILLEGAQRQFRSSGRKWGFLGRQTVMLINCMPGGLSLPPRKSGNGFVFRIALNQIIHLIPKGERVPATHSLYRTKKEEKKSWDDLEKLCDEVTTALLKAA